MCFSRSIGFDELHDADVMKPGDKLLSWGYPEDVFYQRVFEYLERYRGQKIFAYIGVNTTNHFPFYDEEKRQAFPQFARALPFLRADTLRKKLPTRRLFKTSFLGKCTETSSKRVTLRIHIWSLSAIIRGLSGFTPTISTVRIMHFKKILSLPSQSSRRLQTADAIGLAHRSNDYIVISISCLRCWKCTESRVSGSMVTRFWRNLCSKGKRSRSAARWQCSRSAAAILLSSITLGSIFLNSPTIP